MPPQLLWVCSHQTFPEKVLGLYSQARSNYLKKTSRLPMWVCLASHRMASPLVGMRTPWYTGRILLWSPSWAVTSCALLKQD